MNQSNKFIILTSMLLDGLAHHPIRLAVIVIHWQVVELAAVLVPALPNVMLIRVHSPSWSHPKPQPRSPTVGRKEKTPYPPGPQECAEDAHASAFRLRRHHQLQMSQLRWMGGIVRSNPFGKSPPKPSTGIIGSAWRHFTMYTSC